MKKIAPWGDRRVDNFLAVEYPDLVPIYKSNKLAEDDLLALLRAVFFAPFTRDAGKYDRITAKDLAHRSGCSYNDGRIRYHSGSIVAAELPDLTEHGIWVKLLADTEAVTRRVFGQELSGATCTSELKRHAATCPCGARVERRSAHVHITFAGRTIAREFSLAHPPNPS